MAHCFSPLNKLEYKEDITFENFRTNRIYMMDVLICPLLRFVKYSDEYLHQPVFIDHNEFCGILYCELTYM